MSVTQQKVALNGREFELVEGKHLVRYLEGQLSDKWAGLNSFFITAVFEDDPTMTFQLKLIPMQGRIDKVSLKNGGSILFTFRMVEVQGQSRTITGTWDISRESGKIKFNGSSHAVTA
jgi:hypothetical protein